MIRNVDSELTSMERNRAEFGKLNTEISVEDEDVNQRERIDSRLRPSFEAKMSNFGSVNVMTTIDNKTLMKK